MYHFVVHVSIPGILCVVRHTKSVGSLISFSQLERPLADAAHRHMRRALGLRHGVVAGDVVLLVKVGLGCSVIVDVFGVLSFLLFPLVDIFRDKKPYVIVLQIITSSGFGFFILHKFIQVVFLSFGWSSCSPLSLR